MTTSPNRPRSVEEWLAGKSPEELDALEHQGRLFYPDTIKLRGEKPGTWRDHPVYLRVPDPRERALAIVEAIAWVRDQTRDRDVKTVEQARARLGQTSWDEVESYHFMSYAIYERTPPTPTRWRLGDGLMVEVPRGALADLVARVQFLVDLEDPRLGELDGEGLIRVVTAIGEKRNLSPLVALDGASTVQVIMFMAEELRLSPTFRPFAPSPETSTPGL